MKAIIIARVSSKDQEDGLSLEAQLRRLNNYIADKKLELIQEPHQLVESSTRGDRKHFMKILTDAFELVGNEPLAIVTDRVDRFQRGFKEQVFLGDKISAGKVVLHFVSENLIVDNNSKTDTWIRYDMSIMGAKMYCLYVSDNTRKALDENLAQGRPIGKLPVGYKNVKETINGKERSQGVIDMAKAPLIKEAFELYSTGTYSIKKLAKILKEKGLTVTGKHKVERPISTSHLERTLKDPIYYGIYRIKGKDYTHSFGNIISKELYDVCQDIKEGKSRYQERYREKEYIFKGLLRCDRCGKYYSTYTQKGHNYAKCNSDKEECDNENVSEKLLLSQLKSILEGLIIPPEYMEEIIDDIKRITEDKNKYEREQVDTIERRLKDIDGKLDTLLNMRLEQSITQDVYNKKANELMAEQEQLQGRRNNYFNATINYGKVVTDLVSITSRAWQIFESSSIERKRQLLGLIASNFTIDGKNLCVELNSPFDVIANLNKTQEWGHILNLFRTQIIESNMGAIVNSIKILFERFNIVFDSL